MTTLGTDDWIGLRVARLRDIAGLTQQQLADRVIVRGKPITRAYLSQIENGHKAVSTRRLLIALAEALGVSTTQLTATPPTVQGLPERAMHDAVPLVRAALDGAQEFEPVFTETLMGDIQVAMSARMGCDYRALAEMLPGIVGRSLALAESGEEPALRLFAQATVTAALALRPFGYIDLATRLAERAQWAASQIHDVAAVAAADYARAQASLAGGVNALRKRSLVLAERAADTLQGQATDEALAWYVMCHLQAGLSAATLGQDELAMGHIDEAAGVAARLNADPWRMEPTLANVGTWRVAAAVEGGDPGRAPEYSRQVRAADLRTVQRRAHLLTHTGQALFLDGRHDDAVQAFLAAHREAPSEVEGRPRVREVVGHMLRGARRRAGSEQLRDLAVKVGVDPLAVTE